MEEHRIGHVVNVLPREHKIEIRVEQGTLHPHDLVHVKGSGIDQLQRIERIDIGDQPVREARSGQVVAIHSDYTVPSKARPDVFLVRSEFPGEEYV